MNRVNRLRTLTLALIVATATLALNSTVNAQLFRWNWGGGCQGGYCYQKSCQKTGSCAGGVCSVPSSDASTEIATPETENASCSIQSVSATYDLADKIEITYTRAKFKCIQCGIALETPLEENAVYECTNCRKQYAVKEGSVYDITKTADEGYQKADVAGKTDEKNTLISALLQRVNAARARYGLCALAQDSNLEAQSYNQAYYCARAGYLWHGAGAAEILAMNWQGFDCAISQWLNSPPHRSLLLNGGFRFAGVATYRDGYGRVWCAVRFR